MAPGPSSPLGKNFRILQLMIQAFGQEGMPTHSRSTGDANILPVPPNRNGEEIIVSTYATPLNRVLARCLLLRPRNSPARFNAEHQRAGELQGNVYQGIQLHSTAGFLYPIQ